MFTLSYTYSREDYAEFFNYMLLCAPGKKMAKIKSHVKFFFYFTFLLLLIKFSSGGAFDSYFFFSIGMFAIIYILPLFTLKGSYSSLIRQFTSNPLNENLFSKLYITFTERGISSSSNFGETFYNWSSIVKKEENRNYYFLYLTSEQAIQIPKRLLRSETEKNQLERIFSQWLSFSAEVGHLVKE